MRKESLGPIRKEAWKGAERTGHDCAPRYDPEMIRDASAKKSARRKKIGRPRTSEQIEKLILKLAKDNGWGYTRILGELRKLGIQSVTRNTVKKILKLNGYETGPNRGPGTGMSSDTPCKNHVAVRFFLQEDRFQTGLRDIFVLVFLNVKTRSVFITPSTYKPTKLDDPAGRSIRRTYQEGQDSLQDSDA